MLKIKTRSLKELNSYELSMVEEEVMESIRVMNENMMTWSKQLDLIRRLQREKWDSERCTED